MSTHLVWFRNDLRIHDNLALTAACRGAQNRVMAVFIATPQQWRQHDMAPRQAWFIWQHLQGLKSALAEKNIPLFYGEVDDFDAAIPWLDDFCQSHQVDELFYNYQYELNEQRRDARVERELKTVICQGFDDAVLLAPGSITTGNNEMYKVFTPFSRAFLKRLQEGLPECVRAPAIREQPLTKTPALKPFDYPMEALDETLFPLGETAAIARLRHFCQHTAQGYEDSRNFPAQDGTSRVSAYLTCGVLSPRQCLHRLLTEWPQALNGGPGSVWLNELIWREFYIHLLVAWPKLSRHQPFSPWTDNVKWSKDQKLLKAWEQGQTGYPIVDAAMRQLNNTGWMHNRLRMIVASFLTKDLLIDWRLGERYFISQLVDGFLASNNGGWQWASSTGTDSAPYFRIFNPTTQGQRFDPDGEFIRQWVPELATLPDKAIHTPWEWADKQQITLDYPRPMVDHKQARADTLAAWQAARDSH